MWVLDEKLREAEQADRSNVLWGCTGMNPGDGLTQLAMADFKAKTEEELEEAMRLGSELTELISENAKTGEY